MKYEQIFLVGEEVVVANKIHARPAAIFASEVNRLRLTEHVNRVTVSDNNENIYTKKGDPATVLEFAGYFESGEKIRVKVETDSNSPSPSYGSIQESFRRMNELLKGWEAEGYKVHRKPRHPAYQN
jgi:hypothetical protein